jgi:hypothetical protein
LKGVLAVEYNSSKSYDNRSYTARMRVIFYAEPKDDALQKFPKSSPDFESAGACWCTLDDMERGLKLRGDEPLVWARYVKHTFIKAIISRHLSLDIWKEEDSSIHWKL